MFQILLKRQGIEYDIDSINPRTRSIEPLFMLCNGKKARGGKCNRPAGFGTTHLGTGRCFQHEHTDPIFPMLYNSSKIESNNKYCRSPLELKVFKELDMNPEVTSFLPEPFEIPYMYKGRTHQYIPDILINYSDGTKELVEIKSMQTIAYKTHRNLFKFRVAKKYAEQNGLKFRIWICKGTSIRSRVVFPTEGKYENWQDAYNEWEKYLKKESLNSILSNPSFIILIVVILLILFGLFNK